MVPSSFKKTAIAGAYDFFQNQAEPPRKPVSGQLVGAFNLPRLADLMNASDYRHTVTHILLADDSVRALGPDMTFHAEAGKVQVKAKGQPIGDLLLLFYNDSSMLKLERRAVRLIGGAEHGQRLAQLQDFIGQQPVSVASRKSQIPERQINLLKKIIAGDVNALAEYFDLTRARLMKYVPLPSFDDSRREDAVQEAFITIFKKMQQPDWAERKFASPYQIVAFIGGVIRNRALNDAKLAFNRHCVSIDDGLAEIDPDKQEHHAVDIAAEAPSHLTGQGIAAADPLDILQQYDCVTYLSRLEEHVAQNPGSAVRYLIQYVDAREQEDMRDVHHAKNMGLSLKQMFGLFRQGRTELESSGLGRVSLMAGTYNSSLSTFDHLRQEVTPD